MDPLAKKCGRDAEDLAVRHLRAQGYEILARNLRTKSGEIDVVARDGRVLVIVEVRYRGAHFFDAWRSLTAGKRERMARAAREARHSLRIPPETPVRFDVFLASQGGASTHLRGALSTRGPYRA
jgi:putative endonuclease